jgi:hypothetical protein
MPSTRRVSNRFRFAYSLWLSESFVAGAGCHHGAKIVPLIGPVSLRTKPRMAPRALLAPASTSAHDAACGRLNAHCSFNSLVQFASN